MKIIFRANIQNVGYGHVKRCLSVAEQFVRMGYEPVFYVDDEAAVSLFNRPMIAFYFVKNEQAFLDKLQHTEAKLMVLDGYFANEAYIEQVRMQQELFIVILDSLKQGLMGADLLVNPAFYAPSFYAQEQQDKLLIGSEYTILSSEYKDAGNYLLRNVQTILITMGGMDPANITAQLLPALVEKYSDIMFYVVVGNYFKTKAELAQLAKVFSNIQLLENVSSLSTYIEKSDLCISAAGTTVFEIARYGRPMLLFSQEENQLYSSRFWEKTKGVVNVGYYEQQLQQQYIAHLDELISNEQKRKQMSEALFAVSTYGTETLVNAIVHKFNTRKW